MKKQGLLIVVSGPSGTGKGTVCKALLAAHPEIAYSVSATTRSPREGEQNGVNYYFTEKAAFEKMIANGELLEWAEVYGNYYGTPLKKIQEKLSEGQDMLLEIDTQGAMKVKKQFPEGLYIILYHRRCRSWKSASAAAEPRQRRALPAGWVRRQRSWK